MSLLLSSCATIFTGTKDNITFNSKPVGAGVYKDGIKLCTTPCTVKIKRSVNDTDIEFKLDGYNTKLITSDKELNLVSIINLGNVLGWGIDALSGSLMKYDTKTYEVDLESKLSNSHRIDINTQDKKIDVYVIK